MTRIGFKRFQPICLSIFGNVPGCCRPQHPAGLWWNGNMLESKVDYSLWTIFPAWMCCRPLFQCGRQVSISVRISKFPCAVSWFQPGSYFGRNCWLSWLQRSKSQLYQSWPPQIWRFSAVPYWNESFSGCMLLSGFLALAIRLYGFVWHYRCVHWLIVAGTCSTLLQRRKQNQVSRKSTQPQVLGIYIVTLILVFPHTRPSFHAIRPLFLCCDSTQIEMGPI